MIRAAFKLSALYFIAWAVSTQWNALNTVFRSVLSGVIALLPAESTLAPVAGLLVVALAAHLVLLPLWLSWVRVDRRTGRVRVPLPKRPLRVLLSGRVKRFLCLFFLEALFMMVTLRSLEAVVAPASAGAPEFIDEGGPHALWFAYGGMHLLVVVLVGVALRLAARSAARREGLGYGFVEYHAESMPVPRALAWVVALAVFPVAITAAFSHAHPLHLWAIGTWLIGLALIAALAQMLTLRVERRRDRWLQELDATEQGPLTVRERVLGTLHPDRTEFPFLVPGEANRGRVASQGIVDREVSLVQREAAPDKAARGVPREHRVAGAPAVGVGPVAPDNEGLAPPEHLEGARSEGLFHGEEVHGATREAPAERVGSWAGRFGLVGAFVVLLVAGASVGWAWFSLPGAEETRRLARSAHIHVVKDVVESRPRVRLLGTRYDYSLNTRLANVSEHFLNAVIASEDHRFFEHGAGYKLAKFVQAGLLCGLVKVNPFAATRVCRGNSTLGQQLARNLFLSEERSIRRKLRELVWAIKMEWGLSKHEILELYVNRLYLGRGNFGVEMASRAYFSKSASALNAAEAAVLAAAIKRPGWNWHQQRNAALERGRLVFALMRRHGYLRSSDSFPERFTPRRGKRDVRKPYLGHLWQWVRPQVAKVLSDFPSGEYKVVTSLDAEVQVYAERRLAQAVARLRARGIPASQGAFVALRPDGEVLAMVGGVGDNVVGRGVNRAKRTQGLIPRPPASAFKPFVYLAALEQGLTPFTSIDAGPVAIDVPGSAEPYRPSNHDGRTYGRISLRDGLVHSINSAAVHLLHDTVGFDRLMDVCVRLGIDVSRFRRQWGLALGQSGVSPLEMASAYAVFANGGFSVSPFALRALTTDSGRTVWERSKPRRRRAFGPRTISALNAMLTAVIREGTGRRARPAVATDLTVAGKTGTGDEFVDAWFVGYTPDLVMAVWIGNDVPRGMPGVYGGTAPAETFNAVLSDLLRHTTVVQPGVGLPGEP